MYGVDDKMDETIIDEIGGMPPKPANQNINDKEDEVDKEEINMFDEAEKKQDESANQNINDKEDEIDKEEINMFDEAEKKQDEPTSNNKEQNSIDDGIPDSKTSQENSSSYNQTRRQRADKTYKNMLDSLDNATKISQKITNAGQKLQNCLASNDVITDFQADSSYMSQQKKGCYDTYEREVEQEINKIDGMIKQVAEGAMFLGPFAILAIIALEIKSSFLQAELTHLDLLRRFKINPYLKRVNNAESLRDATKENKNYEKAIHGYCTDIVDKDEMFNDIDYGLEDDINDAVKDITKDSSMNIEKFLSEKYYDSGLDPIAEDDKQTRIKKLSKSDDELDNIVADELKKASTTGEVKRIDLAQVAAKYTKSPNYMDELEMTAELAHKNYESLTSEENYKYSNESIQNKLNKNLDTVKGNDGERIVDSITEEDINKHIKNFQDDAIKSGDLPNSFTKLEENLDKQLKDYKEKDAIKKQVLDTIDDARMNDKKYLLYGDNFEKIQFAQKARENINHILDNYKPLMSDKDRFKQALKDLDNGNANKLGFGASLRANNDKLASIKYDTSQGVKTSQLDYDKALMAYMSDKRMEQKRLNPDFTTEQIDNAVTVALKKDIPNIPNNFHELSDIEKREILMQNDKYHIFLKKIQNNQSDINPSISVDKPMEYYLYDSYSKFKNGEYYGERKDISFSKQKYLSSEELIELNKNEVLNDTKDISNNITQQTPMHASSTIKNVFAFYDDKEKTNKFVMSEIDRKNGTHGLLRELSCGSDIFDEKTMSKVNRGSLSEKFMNFLNQLSSKQKGEIPFFINKEHKNRVHEYISSNPHVPNSSLFKKMFFTKYLAPSNSLLNSPLVRPFANAMHNAFFKKTEDNVENIHAQTKKIMEFSKQNGIPFTETLKSLKDTNGKVDNKIKDALKTIGIDNKDAIKIVELLTNRLENTQGAGMHQKEAQKYFKQFEKSEFSVDDLYRLSDKDENTKKQFLNDFLLSKGISKKSITKYEQSALSVGKLQLNFRNMYNLLGNLSNNKKSEIVSNALQKKPVELTKYTNELFGNNHKKIDLFRKNIGQLKTLSDTIGYSSDKQLKNFAKVGLNHGSRTKLFKMLLGKDTRVLDANIRFKQDTENVKKFISIAEKFGGIKGMIIAKAAKLLLDKKVQQKLFGNLSKQGVSFGNAYNLFVNYNKTNPAASLGKFYKYATSESFKQSLQQKKYKMYSKIKEDGADESLESKESLESSYRQKI